jgi:hypothetical protein
MRNADQWWAKAEELRQMGLTARTADTVTSLIALAERFEALALKRFVRASRRSGDRKSD